MPAVTARRHGEIDIVAQDGDTLVFVEVKFRMAADCGSAAEAVTRPKQRRLGSMAADYLARHDLSAVACRFDVIAIDGDVLTVIEDAFQL